MDGLTALVAGLMGALREFMPADVCPGGWAWAVSAFGTVIGLLPAMGAVVVALVRRRIGSRYGVGASALLAGIGVLSAGLLPLVVFTAVGQVFATAAAGSGVDGLTTSQLRDLGGESCFLTQSDYLGGYSVRSAFDPDRPLRFGLALVLLVLFPLLTSVFVAIQARLSLRRGPSWPSKFFWLPLLAVPFLAADAPAGSSGHLWVGASVGGLAGIVVVLIAGRPSQQVVQRSLASASRAPAARTRPPDQQAVRPSARRPQAQVGRGVPPTLVAPAPPFVAAPPLTGMGGRPGAPRFRLLRRLGSGGFGRVWLAEDHRLGHPVALKAAHAPDAETEQRIQREARALAAVRHPNCIRVHDLLPAASDPGLAELEGLVIVMEYVEGPSLGELIRSRGALDDVAAARVWAGVAGALDAAHSRGVMHRDVKPGNVVVDRSGLAHLIDFGIARKTGDATMTMAGFVLGTPDFLSPEAACGERATPASDAWQLAATVSYALTGHPPRGGHPDAVSGLRAAASGAALTHLPQRSAHLALLRAALDNDPTRRPSLRVAQQALEDWLRRTGVPVASGATRR